MNRKRLGKTAQRILATFISVCIVLSNINITALGAETTNSASGKYSAVADPGTAHTFETMMGTDADGNRYAGRVWVDKSVYTDGQTAVLNNSGADGSTFEVALEDDEAFQIIFSALGSSMTTTTTSSTTGPMDVVIILDNSSSMGRYTNTATKYSRLEAVTDASNKLISQILESEQNRLAVVTYSTNSSVILPLDSYEQSDNVLTLSSWSKGNADSSGGVRVEDGDGKMTAKATILGTNTTAGSTNTGFQRGTNLQSGINAGMNVLNNATNTTNRTPVVIVLTDGVADTAVTSNWFNVSNGTYKQPSDNTLTEGVALSTLLNASYWKASLEDKYGKAAKVYGVGVDLGENSDAEIVMNPVEAFNANGTSTAKTAYSWFSEWQNDSSNITKTDSYRQSWTFNQLSSTSTVTKADVVANINYVDTYYPVSSAQLDSVFTQIYEAISSGAFNPIVDSTTVEGATGEEHTPLIYVDNIGQYMEVKEIQSVTLFGASFGVTDNGDGTYTVQTGTGTNPTTNEEYNTSEDIIITVSENADGSQKLQIKINQEVLPIILEQVMSNTVGGVTTATINELAYNPLRVYYTVGLDADILLPNGEIDISKIDSEYAYIDDTTGKITFYSNAFGVMNTTDADDDNLVELGDAHVGFKPSAENRYYYHQSNQGIYTSVTAKDGSTIDWEADEYGVLYEEDKYNFTLLTYDEYKALKDDAQVYTYVTYYRPTASASDSATAAEKVTYIVYTNWGYLKESVAFYDYNADKYVNYDATNGYTTSDTGYAIAEDKVETVISAYLTANPNADIKAMLGVGSLRTSRLHNMTVAKSTNDTLTAEYRYAPEYTYETATVHNGNDVVVWLGNNGRLTTTIDTGIALTKAVTETIGNADDTYALTVTVPSGVTATPIVKDANGNDVTASLSTYVNNVLTVNVKAGETVYVSGIPTGTTCAIGENIPDSADYYVSSKTDTVTIPALSAVLNGTVAQFVDATVTNAPNKYGNLYITKEIASDHNIPESILNEEFAVEVNVGTALAGKKYTIEDSSSNDPYEVTVDNNGLLKFNIKARQTIEILGLPAGTKVTVTEILTNAQTEIFAVAYRTRNHTGEDADDNNEVRIPADANGTAVITNTYTPKYTTVDLDIAGTKNFAAESGAALPSGSFNFKVQQWNGTAWVDISGKTGKVEYAANESGTKPFTIEDVLAGIEYKEAGSFAYQVLEVKGSVTNVTYDRTLYTFTVTVTDNGGQLVATVTDLNNTEITDGSYEVVFNNTYHTAPVSIDIVKNVVNNSGDTEISKAGFAFKAVQTDENWKTLTGTDASTITVYSDAAGEARFVATYTAAGRYYYVVSEVNAGEEGWSYSKATYHVTVIVTEDNSNLTSSMTIVAVDGTTVDGESASVTGNSGKISFKNIYDPTDATVDLDVVVKKSLTGRDLVAGEFTFEVYNNGTATNPVLSGTNDAQGNVDFNGVLTFSQVGKYEYDIVENAGNLAGMTYDSTIYDLVVEVEDDRENGKLVATYYFEDSTTNTVTFKNTYTVTPTEYTISGTKVLTGRAMAAGEFSFELYEGDKYIETVGNKADGSFQFSKITYTKAGTYTYTIKEVKGNVPGITYTGVNSPITVTVTVKDNNSVLSAEADVTNANIKFENSYSAASATVTFDGKKTLKGATLNDNTFTFKLYETDHTFDITSSKATLLSTEKNVNGEFVLDIIEYNESNTHFYVIVEDATVDPIENVVYDSTQHRFRVQVRDNGTGQLTVVVLNLNTGMETNPDISATASATFTNATFDEVTEKEVYLENNVTTEIDGKKVNAGDILTYYITYTNYTGEDVVVDIMDTIPEHTSYVDGSVSHNGSYAGAHVNWVLNVAKGESVTVSFDVKVDETDAIVANVAEVRDGINTYKTNEVVNHTIEDPVEKDVFGADGITASIDGKKVYAGDTLVYTINYTNASADKVSVKITDDIPEHTTYVTGSADNGGVYANGKLTWEIAEVQPWSTVAVAFKVTVDANIGAETIINKANIVEGQNSYTTNEVTNYTVKDEVKKDVFSVEDTEVSIDGKKVYAGDTLLYAISYKNTAKEKASVTITDTIPKYTTYVDGSADNDGVYDDGKLTWNLEVAAGESVTVSFKVTVDDAKNATVANKAEIKEGKNSYITNEVTNQITEEVENVTPPSAPQTGDSTSVGTWSTLMFTAIMVCGVVLILEKKRREV